MIKKQTMQAQENTTNTKPTSPRFNLGKRVVVPAVRESSEVKIQPSGKPLSIQEIQTMITAHKKKFAAG